MYKHEDCACKSKKCEYARAYILPQKYENLYSCKEGFLRGTIFKDLYKPYHHHDHAHTKMHEHECEHKHEYEHHYDVDCGCDHNYEYKKMKVER